MVEINISSTQTGKYLYWIWEPLFIWFRTLVSHVTRKDFTRLMKSLRRRKTWACGLKFPDCCPSSYQPVKQRLFFQVLSCRPHSWKPLNSSKTRTKIYPSLKRILTYASVKTTVVFYYVLDTRTSDGESNNSASIIWKIETTVVTDEAESTKLSITR